MLLSRSRSVLLMAALVLPAITFTTACQKSKAKPEIRLARTTQTAGSGANDSSLLAGANGSDPSFTAGAGWNGSGAPPLNSLGSDGTMTLAGNTRGADPFKNATLDPSTGLLANTANMSGVEDAQFTSELQMVHFEFDSHEISDAWQQVLTEHASWINQNPRVLVHIEGHTDERGTEEYNISLGQRRADAVRTFLVGRGVDANRLSTISYGKMRPLSFDTTPEAHSLNRRAMFLVYKNNNDNSLASAGSMGF